MFNAVLLTKRAKLTDKTDHKQKLATQRYTTEPTRHIINNIEWLYP